MTARSLTKGDQATTFNDFTDTFMSSLKFARIGRTTQIITSTSIQSEFETEIPIFPGSIISTIISSADIESNNENGMILLSDNIRVKEGTSNIPFISTLLDNFSGLSINYIEKLIAGNFPDYKSSSSSPTFYTYYVDQDLRISRDEDYNVFVYTKIVE